MPAQQAVEGIAITRLGGGDEVTIAGLRVILGSRRQGPRTYDERSRTSAIAAE